MKALITGGGRGIGHAVALELAAAGFDVTITFNASPADANVTVAAVRALGRTADATAVDLSRTDEIHSAIDQVWDQFGPFDGLVNNAGAHNRTAFLDMTPAKWQAVIDLDLTAPAFVAQRFVQRLTAIGRPGSIVNIGSINGVIAYPNLTHYCAAKGGVHLLTRAMALELAPHRVRVNAVAPGLVDTDLTKAIMSDPSLLKGKVDRIPLGRPGKPKDVAQLVRYLLGEESSWMTGNVILIDGGQHIH